MKLLILGGTVFLGRHVVDAALARGHEVTLFNRGQHNEDLYPELEKLRGDRDGNLDALKGRTWDAVVDTCGYVPRLVSDSARLLADVVEHYTFVSSISVYSDFSSGELTEESPVGKMEDETVEEITGETYGPLKALCEQAAESIMPGRVLHVRAGLIVGPYDPTDRFTYWPVRVANGGDVLAPPDATAPVQFIDVRDLAEWIVQMADARKAGVYNATGPAETTSFEHFLTTCKTTTDSNASFAWADSELLAKHEIAPWMDLPLWVPPEAAGMLQTNCAKAIDDGLVFRPIQETVHATLQWAQTRPGDYQWRAGLSAEREVAALADALTPQ
ncbi:MAG: SDR family oxidoreductase [Chloroflexota bacterium]